MPLKAVFADETSNRLMGGMLVAQCILGTLKHDMMLRLYFDEYAPPLNEILKKRLQTLVQSGLGLKNVEEA